MNNIVFLTTRTKLKLVFKKQFRDFYQIYKDSDDAKALLKDADEIFEYLDDALVKFSDVEEISLESCLDALSAIYMMMFMLTLTNDVDREEAEK
jgi:hypothetical protein